MYTKLITATLAAAKVHTTLQKYTVAKFFAKIKIRYDIDIINPPIIKHNFLPITLDSHPITYGAET